MSKVVDEIRRLTLAKSLIEAELSDAIRGMKADSKAVAHCALQFRLSYEGRVAELNDDPGCCGAPDFRMHVIQCAQPDSWVHSSFDGWVQRGLAEEFKTKTKK